MKTRTLFTAAACCALSVPAFQANAQTETVVVEEQLFSLERAAPTEETVKVISR